MDKLNRAAVLNLAEEIGGASYLVVGTDRPQGDLRRPMTEEQITVIAAALRALVDDTKLRSAAEKAAEQFLGRNFGGAAVRAWGDDFVATVLAEIQAAA